MCFQDNYLSRQQESSPLDLQHSYGLSVDSRGMSLITVEYIREVG